MGFSYGYCGPTGGGAGGTVVVNTYNLPLDSQLDDANVIKRPRPVTVYQGSAPTLQAPTTGRLPSNAGGGW